MHKIFYYCLCLIFALTCNAQALSFSQKTNHVRLSIIPEFKTISKDTQNITLITAIDIKPEWHIYWDNPGDSGDPTILTFYDSPHYTTTETTHSAPQKFVLEDIITTYIHRQKLYYKTTFKLNHLEDLSHLTFKLVLSYTVCRKNCLPETITLDISLPITSEPTSNPDYIQTLLDAENTFPLPLNVQAEIKNKTLELNIAEHIIKECQHPEFISIYQKKNILSDLPKTTLIDNNHLLVTFDKDELPNDSQGILLCSSHAYYLTPQANTSTSLPNTFAQNLLYYLLTAFLAGLILNLMPCVLPILSLKALYLAAHKEKASPLSALIYLSGVLCSFIILSGLLFYLKIAGTELGWGFQLQSPIFNIFLMILFFIIFLSLIDKLPLPSLFTNTLSKISANQSFLTGFFAVIIACPCTGPFMGAALGYAMMQPPLGYFSIFIALGFGYALPYVLIETFPKLLLHCLPKPGPWMVTFKHILSIPIAITCLWLGWVTYNQLKPLNPTSDIFWEQYSEENINTALKNNTPVFIDFTAKWCLICLLNDKNVLSTPVFKQLVKNNHIRLFKADWTNRDDKIRDALNAYGRNSVPLYIYYAPKNSAPKILPQILTEKILTETLSSK